MFYLHRSFLATINTLSALLLVTALIGCSSDTTGQPSEESKGVHANSLEGVALIVANDSDSSPHVFTTPEEISGERILLQLRTGNEVVDLSEGSLTPDGIELPSFHVRSEAAPLAVDVYIDRELFGSIDVHALPQLPDIPGEIAEAVLDAGEKSFLVDVKLASVSLNGPRSFGEIVSEADQSASDNAGELGISRQALNTCGGGWNGPGNVIWHSTTPGSGGQGFSVAPESNNTLTWAVFADQNIDAIYRSSWGCGTALKVPNPCTVFVTVGASMSYCCSEPWRALGYVPTWINTYSDPYFPDCPLF